MVVFFFGYTKRHSQHTHACCPQVNADKITSGHGWRGALNFERAARTLTAVDIDHHEKEIYMAVEQGYPETLLLVSEVVGAGYGRCCLLARATVSVGGLCVHGAHGGMAYYQGSVLLASGLVM